MDLAAAVGWYLLARDGIVSPATLTWYRSRLAHLVNALGERDVDTITTNDLRAWRKRLTDQATRYTDDKYHRQQPGKLSPAYVDSFIRAVRALWSWLLSEGYTDRDPTRKLERPPQPKPVRKGITAAARAAMLKAAKAGDNPERDFALLKFLDSTGCRRAGAALVRVEDLDLANRRVVVREKGRGGNNKSRTVHYSAETAAALERWLTWRPKTKDTRLFLLTISGISECLERTARRAGVTCPCSPHQWRHAAIRRWLNNGMPLNKASALAGHSSTKVTGDIYGTSSDEELAQARDKWGGDD
jgi:site-specific recombinase XerD